MSEARSEKPENLVSRSGIEAFSGFLKSRRQLLDAERHDHNIREGKKVLERVNELKEYAAARVVGLQQDNHSLQEQVASLSKQIKERVAKQEQDNVMLAQFKEKLKEYEKMILVLQQQRAGVMTRISENEKNVDAADTVIQNLERENTQLWHQVEHMQVALAHKNKTIQILKDRNKILKVQAKDRQEALMESEKQKNNLICKNNQEIWLRQAAEDNAARLEKEVKSLIFTKEQDAAAYSIAKMNWDQERRQYEDHLKNLGRYLQGKQRATSGRKKLSELQIA